MLTAVKVEVKKLLNIGFIKEVPHTTWLANVVMAKKANGNWRMCVDFTNLNKACPKDSYPLSSIDNLVDTALGNIILRFCDAFFGYNQILMWEEVCLKVTIIIDEGVFCYKVMPFGMKNVGATY